MSRKWHDNAIVNNENKTFEDEIGKVMYNCTIGTIGLRDVSKTNLLMH